MAGEMRYRPILRWKAGEKRALRDLHQDDKACITPLIEWSRPGDVSPEEDREVTVPTPQSLARDLFNHWGPRPFLCDLHWFHANVLGEDARALRLYASELANGGLRPVPVIGLHADKDYTRALEPMISAAGWCIRLRWPDIASAGLSGRLNRFLSKTALTWSSTDIFVDFEYNYREMDIGKFCTRVPQIMGSRSFTVGAGSFPKDLGEFKRPGSYLVLREEWVRFYDQISKHLVRRPDFGDYATLHPLLTSAKAGLNPSASIRYTIPDHWLVMKGEGLHTKGGAGYEQYPANALMLVNRHEYAGPDFSAGDRYILRVSERAENPGTPTTWVTAAVNHHLTFVARQLAESYGDLRSDRRYGPAQSEASNWERAFKTSLSEDD